MPGVLDIHLNVGCSGCKSDNMVYYRYKCLRCEDFDLCVECYEKKVELGAHRKTHPLQCLLDRRACRLFFGGGDIPRLSADSFTCPICGILGYSSKELTKHIQAEHCRDTTPVICPICVATPGTLPNRLECIATHINLWHQAIINDRRSVRFENSTGAGSGISPLRPRYRPLSLDIVTPAKRVTLRRFHIDEPDN